MALRPRATRHRLALSLALLGLFIAGAATAAAASPPRVDVLTADGVVDNVMARYIADGVARAASDGAAAVVIELNTPGGSIDSLQTITAALLESSVPTIVWVAPAGARAASAGTLITLAANLAYMAPGTNIGAASPVSGTGADIPGTLGVKVMNDAIASATAIAEARGRPVDWAVSTVKDAKSYPASAALAAGAVDGIAATLDEVLADANGREVTVAGGKTITLDLAGATINEAPMGPLEGFLHLLSDPNIAFLLFVLGGLGLAIELVHPNLLTGIVGAVCLILAAVGFGSLPLNAAGLLLVGLALLLFVLETQITSHGLLTVAGIVCFVLGASVLYKPPGNLAEPAVQVAVPVIVGHGRHRGRADGPDHPGGHPDAPHEILGRDRGCRRPDRLRGRRPGAARSARHGVPRERAVDRADRGRHHPCARHAGPARRLRRPGRDRGTHQSVRGWTGGAGTCRATLRQEDPVELVVTLVAIAFVVIVVLTILYLSVRVVQQYERMVVFRLGKTNESMVRDPGLRFLVPVVDRPVKVDMREQFIEVPSQTTITKDNAPINVDFLIYWRIADSLKSVVNVANFPGALQGVATTTLRAVIGDILLDDVLSKREQINEVLRTKLDEVTERWGGKITTVEIREITPPRDVQDAMNRQLSAERTRRAVITESEGSRQSAINVAEGQKQSEILKAEGERQAAILRAEGFSQALERIYGAAKGIDEKTMTLQYLDALKALGASPSTKFLIPTEFTRLAERVGSYVGHGMSAENAEQ